MGNQCIFFVDFYTLIAMSVQFLYTGMKPIGISIAASDRAGETITIDTDLVQTLVVQLAKDVDLSKFVL